MNLAVTDVSAGADIGDKTEYAGNAGLSVLVPQFPNVKVERKVRRSIFVKGLRITTSVCDDEFYCQVKQKVLLHFTYLAFLVY